MALTNRMPEYIFAPSLPLAAKILVKLSVNIISITSLVVRCGFVRPCRILEQYITPPAMTKNELRANSSTRTR
jgi:hypothetical protein